MDTSENSGVAQPEQPLQAVPVESEKQIQIPIENAETPNSSLNEEDTTMLKSQGKEQDKQTEVTREKPDPLGRRIVNLPLNEMKAGYDYAFGKKGAKS